MIEQLKGIFQDAIAPAQSQNEETLLYKTNDGELIYLLKSALLKEQKELLDVFLTPISTLPNETNEQLFWYKLLVERNESASYTLPDANSFRFTYFRLTGKTLDQTEFQEAVESMYSTTITIVWETPMSGFIVEYISNVDQEFDLHSFAEAIMADFYVRAAFFLGTAFTNINEAIDFYAWEKNIFETTLRFYPKLQVVEKNKLIPFLFANEVSTMTRHMLLTMLHGLKEDEEQLKTIRVFLECNLNATLAAKELFIHRNSLQYRIDKFIEKTGIDVKQFSQAAAMYMLLTLDKIEKANLTKK